MTELSSNCHACKRSRECDPGCSSGQFRKRPDIRTDAVAQKFVGSKWQALAIASGHFQASEYHVCEVIGTFMLGACETETRSHGQKSAWKPTGTCRIEWYPN